MKKLLLFCAFILITVLSIAQPANDICSGAQVIVIPSSGNACVVASTVSATSDLTTDACDTGTPGNEVWFTYTAVGAQNTITVTPTGAPSLTQSVVTIGSTGCASGTYNNCGASATNGGTATANWTYTPGTQVWISVESNNAGQGSFNLCITSIDQPPAPGNSCATAAILCDQATFTLNPFPNNSSGLTPPCFFSALQQPVYYQFTVGQTGSLNWNADVLGVAEYDWAIYDITSACPGTTVSCNYNYASGNSGAVGMQAGPGACSGEYCDPITVTAGNTYLMIIDNYSNNTVGFTLDFAGSTFQMAPTSVFTTSVTTGCAPLNVSFTNSSIADISSSWNFGNGATSTATNPAAQNYATAGTYLISLTTTSSTGCTDVSSGTVIVKPVPVLTAEPNLSYCATLAVPLNAFVSTPTGATFSWTNSNTAIGLAASGTGSVPAFTAANLTSNPISGTITVTPTLNGCTGLPITYTVTVNPQPTAGFTLPANQCFTGNSFTFTNTGLYGSSYLWTFPSGTPATSTALSPSGVSFSPAGTYSITHLVTATGGCTATLSQNITIYPMPTGSITAQTNVLCNGAATGSVTVAGAGTSGYTYSLNGGAYQASGTFNTLIAGVYTVTVKDVNGCTVIVPVTITQPTAVTGAITAQTNVLCNGANTGSVTVAGSNGTAGYTYSLNGGAYQASGTFSTLIAGVYTVTVKDANGCTVNIPVTITQPTLLTGAITAQTNILCNGANTGSVTVAGSNGTAGYTYSLNGGAYQASGTFSTLIAGVYTVTVKDANGCTVNVPVTITEPSQVTVTAVKTDATCGVANGSITATGANGTATYSYSIDGSTFQAGTNFPLLAAGAYTVTVKDANGCTNTTTITINDLSGLTGSITAQTNVNCAGGNNGSVTVAGAGTSGYTYSLNGGAYQASGTFNTLIAGVYTVTVKDVNGCTVTVPVTITEAASVAGAITAQVNILCNGANTGSVTVAGSSGTAGYTYSLNAGAYQASGTFNTLIAGVYTVTVKDANGCTVNVPVTITQPTVLTGAITAQTNILCNGANTGSVTVAGSDGTAGYTYSLNAGAYQASGTFNTLIAGVYTVTVKDANGCTVNVPVTITEPTLVTVTAVKTDATCGVANGSITATGANGTATYSYSIDGSTFQAGTNFPLLAAGAYTVTVKDANGCTNTTTITINDLSGLTGSITAQINVLCNGGNNGSVTVAGAGTSGYTYSLNGGAYQASGTFNTLIAGVYSVTVKDVNGCNATVPVTIIQPSALTGNLVSQVNILCFGGTGGATVSATGGIIAYSYSIDGGVYVASAVFTGLSAGSHTITIKDANNCTTTVAVTITQPTVLVLTPSASNAICTAANGSATIAVTGGTTNYSYSWNTSPVQSTVTAANIIAGNYTVTVTDANLCVQTASVSVGSDPGATATISSSTNVTCPNADDGTATVSMGAGSIPPFTYAWTPGTQTTVTAIGLSPANYSVTVTDGYGCIGTASVLITQPVQLTYTFTTTNVSCSGGLDGSATINPAGGTPGYTYLWTPGPYTTQTISGVSAGSYTCVFTDANGCPKTGITAITQPSGMTLSSTKVDATCNQSNGNATVTVVGGTGPYSYSWSDPAAQTSATATGLASNTYIVTVTDANLCAMPLSVTINNLAGPVATVFSHNDVSCFGLSDGSITDVVIGGTLPINYSWAPSGGTLPTAANLAAGTYTMTATDINGCIATSSYTLTEPLVLNTALVGTNPSCFGFADGSIVSSTSGGTTPYAYQWVPGSVITSGINSLLSGNYSLVITDAHGCTNNPSTTLINPAQVTASTVSVDVSCSGMCDGTATVTALTGTGPFTYLWSDNNAQTTQTATGLCSGVFTAIVSDANGCVGTAQATIISPVSLSIAITAQGNVTCYGACDGFAQATVTGGSAPYSYLWMPGGIAGGTVNNLCANTYTVTVTDANGCTAITTVNIIQPNPLIATITSESVTCNNLCDGSATAVYTGGTGPYTFQWMPGLQTTPTIDSICAGVHSLALSDGNGCLANASVVISEPTILAVSTTTLNSSCGVANGEACAAVTGGVYPFTYSWNTSPVAQATSCASGIYAGVYTISVTDAHGCSVTGLANVNDNNAPIVTIPTSLDVTCNGAANGSAQANIIGGIIFSGPNPYSISWTPGPGNQNTAFVNNLAGGIYSIIVTDSVGCIGIASVTIDEPATLISAITNTTPVSCYLTCDGNASVNVGGGTSPYTYLWNDIATQTTITATGLCGQSYTVTVTDSNGCTSASVANIPSPVALTIQVLSVTNVSCNEGDDGQISIEVLGGSPAYTYDWAPGVGSSAQVTNLAAGSYSVTATDVNGCTKTASIDVQQPAALSFSTTMTPSHCTNGADGTASIFVAGGVSPYTYFWTPSGITSSSINNVSAGIYTVQVTDNNECTSDTTVEITNVAGPTGVSFAFNSPPCNGASLGWISAIPAGGQAPYTYLWSGIGAQTTQTATSLAAGAYTVIVTDFFHCNVIGNFILTQPQPLSIIVSPPDTICIGQSTQIYGSGYGGTQPYTYTYTPAMTPPGPPYTVSPVVPTVYQVSVTDNNNCFTNALSIPVFVHPQIGVNASPASVCSGDSVLISALAYGGTGGPYTYSWTPGTATSSSLYVTPTIGSGTVAYTVHANDIGCSIIVDSTIMVTVNPLPQPGIINLNTSGCEDFTTTFSTNTSPVVSVYTWNFGDGTILNQVLPPAVHVYENPGLYTVTLTDTTNLGCYATVTEVDFITVFPEPYAEFTISPTTSTTTAPLISFTDHSTGGDSLNWDFYYTFPVNGLYTSTNQNPTFAYSDTGTFMVQQIVYNKLTTCSDTILHPVRISPEYVLYAPNAFTPYNHDGINDVFMPKGVGVDPDNFEMTIFDRWGNMIYKTTDSSKGWNGKANEGGKVAQADVYIWKVYAKDFSGDNHRYIGTVTLVR